MNRSNSGVCSGMTLVEVMVALVILLLVLGGALTALLNSQHSFVDQMEDFTINQAGRRITERLTEEIRQISPASVNPPVLADANEVSYQKVTGYAGGAPQLGPVITVKYEAGEGETANGMDDNGDGRIDEGYVTYKVGAAAPTRLVGDVLSVRFNTTTMGMSFAVEIGRRDRAGVVTRETFTQVATFRND